MTDIDYAGLREKAEKASGGAWVAEPEAPAYTARQRVYAPELGDEQDDTICEAVDYGDAEFIAAADPQTVLALLDEIERLGNELAEAHTHFAIQEGRIARFKRERDEALAVIEKIRDYVSKPDILVDAYVVPRNIQRLLVAAPADALRERDAEKWYEGHYVGVRNVVSERLFGLSATGNPYLTEDLS